jgi:outer membrane protein assembly factor BamD
MIDAYQEGLNALENQDGFTAAKKFSEAELLFPQSEWAPRAALMAAYSYFTQEYYSDTIYEIERFFKTYPLHPRTDYDYYLLAVAYYDQIVDETRDLDSIMKSKIYFEYIIQNYPNTDYAFDSKFKLGLINEILASKEMYLARYYFEKKKWIPAINRFRFVVENYSESVFIEEALHRLVELHYKIGLVDEAKKYAYLLGYNYQSSEWYENTYKVFNKNYKSPQIKSNKDKRRIKLIERIKSKIF